MRKRKAENRPVAICFVCGKKGEICKDMVITGDYKNVHMDECHDRLIAGFQPEQGALL